MRSKMMPPGKDGSSTRPPALIVLPDDRSRRVYQRAKLSPTTLNEQTGPANEPTRLHSSCTMASGGYCGSGERLVMIIMSQLLLHRAVASE
jgi:hypothetical protein